MPQFLHTAQQDAERHILSRETGPRFADNKLTVTSGTALQPGIIFLTMQELFEKISDLQEQKTTEITLSYLEIYNETLRDLLVSEPSTSKQGLMLREDADQAISVAGLSSHRPHNVQEVMDMLIRGNAARTVSPTDANATSSRSHAVLQINVASKDRSAAIDEPTTMATLSIIDLAGSERASATKNRGERLLEGANINKSLLALGSCINALCDPRKKNHVPYRNSKLTRLLKFSLGGNCKTVMIVCVSPSSIHFDETQNTLRYANRAKNIQTKAVRNVYNIRGHMRDYCSRITEQAALIAELQAQQKDYETIAMAKFKKLEEKRHAMAKESILRIRSAYEHAADDRNERTNNMKRLRHIEKRLALITSWVSSFDQVCELRDGEDPPTSLVAMKKTAQVILAELESSRQHYHQKLAKNDWERGLTTTLQYGIRQLEEADGSTGVYSAEVASLKREAEVLKGRADREAHLAVLEQDKQGDSALVQVLLQAHFETVAIISQIVQMDEQEAVRAARQVLGKLLTSCTEATAQVIRPDGGLQIVQAVPPTKLGTPRKRMPMNIMGPSPMKVKVNLLGVPDHAVSQAVGLSPARPSPMRRKMGGIRRGVAFTASPKKRSPVKTNKRGVRWRDDTEDGKLADFQPTPTRIDSSPDPAVQEEPSIWVEETADETANVAGDESSPLPSFTVTSDLKGKPSRFDSGFLTKKSELSPAPREVRQSSPLQEIAGNTAPRPPQRLSTIRASDNNSSDEASASSSGDEKKKAWPADMEAARRISSAIKAKRASTAASIGARQPHHRQRSPTASASASPPPETGGLFSASHARRMVRAEGKTDSGTSVLSPRSAPVVKGKPPVVQVRMSAAGRTSSVGGKAAWRGELEIRRVDSGPE